MDTAEQIKNLEDSLKALEGKDDAASVSQIKAHRELLEQLKKLPENGAAAADSKESAQA